MSNSLVHFLTVNKGLQMDLWTEWLWGFLHCGKRIIILTVPEYWPFLLLMSLIQKNSLNNNKKIHSLFSPKTTLALKCASVLLYDNIEKI